MLVYERFRKLAGSPFSSSHSAVGLAATTCSSDAPLEISAMYLNGSQDFLPSINGVNPLQDTGAYADPDGDRVPGLAPGASFDVQVVYAPPTDGGDEAELSILELRFEEVVLPLPLGKMNIARFLPPVRLPADGIFLMDGAGGDVRVRSKLSDVRMGRDVLRLEFDVQVVP